MISRLNVRLSRPLVKLQSRSNATVGEKIPINFIKDGVDPIIKADSEYPSWVFSLQNKMPTKIQLAKKLEVQGIDSLEVWELRRLKRLMTLQTIRENNTLASGSDS